VLSNGQTAGVADMRENAEKMFASSRNNHSVTKVLSVDQAGNIATANVTQHLSLDIVNPNTGKTAHAELIETDRDIWKLSSGTWKLTKSTAITQKVLIDGKPIAQ
jgi:hypothetical protein